MEERIPYESMPELDDKIRALEKLIKHMKFDVWASIEFQDNEEDSYYYIEDKEYDMPMKYKDLLREIADNIFGPEDLEYAGLTDQEKAIILEDFQNILGIDIDFML